MIMIVTTISVYLEVYKGVEMDAEPPPEEKKHRKWFKRKKVVAPPATGEPVTPAAVTAPSSIAP
jgi:hypothetical protein